MGSSCDELPQCRNEIQMSEQEPPETAETFRSLRDEVFLEGIKMTVENLPKYNRNSAYVDILHYFYTTIFRKYHNNAMEPQKWS